MPNTKKPAAKKPAVKKPAVKKAVAPAKKPVAKKSAAKKSRQARDQAQAQRCLYEGADAERQSGCCGRCQPLAAYRGGKENLGIHQEEQSSGHR